MPKGGPNLSSKPAVGKEDAKGEGAEKKELVFSSRYKEVITLPSEAHRWDNRDIQKYIRKMQKEAVRGAEAEAGMEADEDHLQSTNKHTAHNQIGKKNGGRSIHGKYCEAINWTRDVKMPSPQGASGVIPGTGSAEMEHISLSIALESHADCGPPAIYLVNPSAVLRELAENVCAKLHLRPDKLHFTYVDPATGDTVPVDLDETAMGLELNDEELLLAYVSDDEVEEVMKRSGVGLLEAAEVMEKCEFQPRKALQMLESQKRAREQAEKAEEKAREQAVAEEDAKAENLEIEREQKIVDETRKISRRVEEAKKKEKEREREAERSEEEVQRLAERRLEEDRTAMWKKEEERVREEEERYEAKEREKTQRQAPQVASRSMWTTGSLADRLTYDTAQREHLLQLKAQEDKRTAMMARLAASRVTAPGTAVASRPVTFAG
eukprot:CAMPEP_0179437644 /NCGR_PEP_ID=MMETSP0799-20121207/21507_1 /TAXON_ID=46947 /ORGANISM="Geminigera cryophila, Strain CCMP2564" /LENGTH=436 /DNA_ID=CAMNT_0021218727 /DNA_START=163 /DNA_END=1470 /DNA_ORIENTATION=-